MERPGFPAVFSEPDQVYRYVLWRVWSPNLPYLCVIGLNPSTAVACPCNLQTEGVPLRCKKHDDNTIWKLIKLAHRLGYGGLCMLNLFAFRATKPPVCFAAHDPIGPDNDHWLRTCTENAGMVIGAWGNDGARGGRADTVRRMLPRMSCFALNDTGQPQHPLYLPDDTDPFPMPVLPPEVSLDD